MISPSRAFYRPGERVEIDISGPFHARITHLGETVADVYGTDTLRWTPPPIAKRGYRVCAETNVGVEWTAFDVLDRWTDAPRYGYLFDFRSQRDDFDLSWMAARHTNGVHFYDWMYRHDRLLPPTPEYLDPLGREMSLGVVRPGKFVPAIEEGEDDRHSQP